MSAALKILHTDGNKKRYIYRDLVDKSNVLFTDFIKMHIQKKQKRLSTKTVENHNLLIKTIERFAFDNDIDNITTTSIGEEFLSDLIEYLQNRGLKQSYVKKIIDGIKGFAGKAARYGYPVDSSYDDVVIKDELTQHIYLTTTDINRLYFYDRLSKIQTQQRDLFIVGCWTGMRYSDYSTLTKADFGEYIKKITQKTKIPVTIPIHDHVKEIFEKYDGAISRHTTIQNFDRMIKLIAKKVGGKFNEPVTYSYTRGGKIVKETKLRWQLISSHTARRSFATNMYLTGRMKTYQIMACTGHTTEKSFFRYIGLNNDEIAKQLGTDIIFKA